METDDVTATSHTLEVAEQMCPDAMAAKGAEQGDVHDPQTVR
jgi:hypothetical protein